MKQTWTPWLGEGAKATTLHTTKAVPDNQCGSVELKLQREPPANKHTGCYMCSAASKDRWTSRTYPQRTLNAGGGGEQHTTIPKWDSKTKALKWALDRQHETECSCCRPPTCHFTEQNERRQDVTQPPENADRCSQTTFIHHCYAAIGCGPNPAERH